MAAKKLDEAALLARLEALEDERSILRTMHEYGHSIDYGPPERFKDCFEPDGAFEKRLRGTASEGRYQGREQLLARVATSRATATGPSPHFDKHLVLNSVITLHGKEATAEAYWALLSSEPEDGVPSLRAFGRYKDRWAKGADGKWRIKERIAEVEARSGGRLQQALKALGA